MPSLKKTPISFLGELQRRSEDTIYIGTKPYSHFKDKATNPTYIQVVVLLAASIIILHPAVALHTSPYDTCHSNCITCFAHATCTTLYNSLSYSCPLLQVLLHHCMPLVPSSQGFAWLMLCVQQVFQRIMCSSQMLYSIPC